MAHRPRSKQCPACGARDCARIIYGLHALDMDLLAKELAGLVVMGGCFMVQGEIFDWHCNVCGHEWLKTSPRHSNAREIDWIMATYPQV